MTVKFFAADLPDIDEGADDGGDGSGGDGDGGHGGDGRGRGSDDFGKLLSL